MFQTLSNLYSVFATSMKITHEDFIALHSLNSTKAQSITHTIEDNLLRLYIYHYSLRIVMFPATMVPVRW